MFGENWTWRPFFGLHPMFGEKLDVGTRFRGGGGGGGHALPSFGPVCGHDDPQKTCPSFV